MDTLEDRILQLEQQIKKQGAAISSLEQHNVAAAQARNRRRQQILLGEAAHALTSVIVLHVFGPAGFPGSLGIPISLKKIDKYGPRLTPEEKSRWEAVQQYLTTFMPFEQLLSAEGALQTLRLGPAYSTVEAMQERATTSLEDLQSWAGLYLPPAAVLPLQKLTEILSTFSSND